MHYYGLVVVRVGPEGPPGEPSMQQPRWGQADKDCIPLVCVVMVTTLLAASAARLRGT
jgi:hypothetical protein